MIINKVLDTEEVFKMFKERIINEFNYIKEHNGVTVSSYYNCLVMGGAITRMLTDIYSDLILHSDCYYSYYRELAEDMFGKTLKEELK